MLPLSNGHTGTVFIMNHLAIRANIFPPSFWILCHHSMKSAYISAPIQFMPVGRRKLEQVNLVPLQNIFLAGSRIDDHWFYRFSDTFPPNLNEVSIGSLFGQPQHQSHPLKGS